MRANPRLLTALAPSLALALVAAGTLPALAAPQDPAAAIGEVNTALAAAVAAQDADAVAALYTEDAMLMAPNAPAATGHEAITAAFQGMIDMGVGSLALTTDEVVVHGDLAHEVGRFVLEGADGSHMDHGKYIVIWKNTADGWKLHRDIFNSDMAMPAH